MPKLPLLLCLLVAGCQTASSNPPQAPMPFVASPLSDAELFAKAKKTLLGKLKDPDSAKFDGSMRRVVADRPDGNKGEYVCGRVNSKNGFGGYTGTKPFAYLVETGAIMMLGESNGAGGYVDAMIDQQILKVCA